MNKTIKNTLCMGIIAATGAAAMISCSDTWDDHYKEGAVTTFEGTTMQAIEAKAPDFADVIKAVGFNRELASENVYTIWAPQNFDKTEWLTLAKTDSAYVVDRFIKNHIARYALSQDGKKQEIKLMSNKLTTMTGEGTQGSFGAADITQANISCANGVLHLIDKNIDYQNNIFEQIQAGYNAATDSLSMYAFLEKWNADSLDENRSVSRGVDENGNKIWVDSVVIRNNTALKNMDALVYEEDSSYIAIIPSAEAYKKRYEIAQKLLVFNPFEDVTSAGACDSLQRYYSNMFAMTDLFYNKNANEHWSDSLKSTNYSLSTWPYNLYYAHRPSAGLHPDKKVNNILDTLKAKGTFVECSNGDAYLVDEYPMDVTEQFFKKINLRTNDNTRFDSEGERELTKNVGSTSITSGIIYDYQTDTIWTIPEDDSEPKIERIDTLDFIGTRNFFFYDVVPASGSVQPNIAFEIMNPSGNKPGVLLSGTYELYLITCPIWAKTGFNDGQKPEDDPRGYCFYATVYTRDAKGEISASGQRLTPHPDDPRAGLSDDKYFKTDYHNKIDTLYLDDVTFEYADYGRSTHSAIIQLQTQIKSSEQGTYSREMLLSGFILKPKFDETAATEAKRK